MTADEKNLEQRLRRALYKSGYQLCKSRARIINLDDFGGYMITNYYTRFVVMGSRFDLELEDVAKFIEKCCD